MVKLATNLQMLCKEQVDTLSKRTLRMQLLPSNYSVQEYMGFLDDWGTVRQATTFNSVLLVASYNILQRYF